MARTSWLAVLQRGYDKSLISQVLPDIFDWYITILVYSPKVLVVSSLNALMHDQIYPNFMIKK